MPEIWKKISDTSVYKGFREIIERLFLLNGKEIIFDIKKEHDPVCILAITEDNQVILVRQFRPGPEAVILELPGGGKEKGETAEAAVTRELLEETGYQPGKIILVKTGFIDAYSTARRSHFVATGCKKIAEPKDDPNEPVEVVLTSLADFRKHLQSGEQTDTATGYLGLDHLGLL